MASNYPSGFNNGLVLREVPMSHMHIGKVFYVNNTSVLPVGGVTGADSNDGTYLRPFATLDFAIGKCTANRGDIIYIMPGHAETIIAADAVDIDKAGISIIGLGQGTLIPTIEYNHADATVAIDADNVRVENMKFNASITTVGIGINIKAAATHASIINCVFDIDIAGTDEFALSIDIKAGCTSTLIEECIFDMDIAAAVAGIKLTGASDQVTIRGCKMYGDYSTSCIAGDTTLSTNFDVQGNMLNNGEGGDLNAQPCIEMLTGSTGNIRDNYIVCNLATKAASVVADTALLFENYYNEDISGAATGGIIGTASADG